MGNIINYIPDYQAQRRYFIFESWSMYKSVTMGKPAPKEVSKLWFYWCKWRKWRYQPNHDNSFLVKINRWTRQYHFQDNWDNPTQAEVWNGIGNSLGKIAK